MQVMRDVGAAPAAAAAARRPARRVLHAGGGGHRAGWPGLSAATPIRFLAVLVVATPCPLLIAIPVAIIGSISLAARRGIIIKDPAVLENDRHLPHRHLRQDRHADLRPAAADRTASWRRASSASEVLRLVGQPGALLEASAGRGRSWTRRSEAQAAASGSRARCQRAARARACAAASAAGPCRSRAARSCSRSSRTWQRACPRPAGGLECVVLVDGRYAATLPLPRSAAGRGRVVHPATSAPDTGFERVLLVSGDREVGGAVSGRAGRHHGGVRRARRPEQKLALVRARDRSGPTPSSWATASTTPRR